MDMACMHDSLTGFGGMDGVYGRCFCLAPGGGGWKERGRE